MREAVLNIQVRRWRPEGRRGRLLADVEAYSVELRNGKRDSILPGLWWPEELEIVMPALEWEKLAMSLGQEERARCGSFLLKFEDSFLKLTIISPPVGRWQKKVTLWRCVLTGMKQLSSRRVSVAGKILRDTTVIPTKKRGQIGMVTDMNVRTRRARKVEP